jgi:hypothetical protein
MTESYLLLFHIKKKLQNFERKFERSWPQKNNWWSVPSCFEVWLFHRRDLCAQYRVGWLSTSSSNKTKEPRRSFVHWDRLATVNAKARSNIARTYICARLQIHLPGRIPPPRHYALDGPVTRTPLRPFDFTATLRAGRYPRRNDVTHDISSYCTMDRA